MCLRYEEIKKQIKHLINEAERNKEGCEGNAETWDYWEKKADHLHTALTEIERAQYQKKPGMN